MKATSLLFFSSSPIALPLFEALLKDDRFVVKGLVCQPDKPVGRGQKLSKPLIKGVAEARGVPVFQPEKLARDEALLHQFLEDRPDFLLTFAYGQILSDAWLNLPLRAPLNVHPSLLPKYRGPSPLEMALLNGDQETGISLMKMVAAMDAGPLAFQWTTPLEESVTAGSLYERVAIQAAEVIPDAIFALAEANNFSWQTQDESRVSFCHKLSKEDSFENFERPLEVVLQRFRAFTPWPGLWTTVQGKRVKLLRIAPGDGFGLKPGQLKSDGKRLWVGTSTTALELLELQMEGKKNLDAESFLRGAPWFIEEQLPS